MPEPIADTNPVGRLCIAGLVALLTCLLFLTYDATASWQFTLPFRGKKLLALGLVAASVSCATLVFQTISHNRILTPEIVGFDALFIFLQTILVFIFGGFGFAVIDPQVKWLVQVGLLLGVMFLLSRVFLSGRVSMHLLVLGGIIVGIMFKSASALLQRLINPADFVVLQDAYFASFNQVNTTLLGISGVALIASLVVVYRLRFELDVLLLGRDPSISLGIPYARRTRQLLMLVTLLIAVSTALVGPVTFLGLLVVHLAYRVAGSYQHRFVLPMSVVTGITVLVGGEALVQYVFQFNTRLSFIVEFIGGLFFLWLLLSKKYR